jgi:DNA-binding NarL/FixJ family response regulator
MRVVIVGPPDARAVLRRELVGGTFDVVDEAPTLAAARDRHPDADAFLITGSASARPTDTTAPPLAETLTKRERDVLELLAEGLPNKAIAARLLISDQTVKFHVAAICGKLGAANRTEAVRLAIRQGLIAI